MILYTLKSDPKTFEQSWQGTLCGELRRNDRDFQSITAHGQGYVLLRETTFSAIDMQKGAVLSYTGREIMCRLNIVLSSETDAGLSPGWCFLSLSQLHFNSCGQLSTHHLKKSHCYSC
jgi:hypothetical protein